MKPYHLLVAASTAVLGPLASASHAAAQSLEQAGFIVRLGTDTLAAEQFSRSAAKLESDLAVRVPVVRRVHYVAALDAAGHITRFEITMQPLGGAGQPVRGLVDFGPDSADVTLTRGDSAEHFRVAVGRGAVPLSAFSHALMEQAVRQARRSGGDSVAFEWLPLGGQPSSPSYVAWHGKDSADVGFFGWPMHARTDRQGRLLSVDGRATTVKVLVTRVKTVDVAAFAEAFAAAERARGPMGQLSGRDTVRATLGAAHVLVDYGRPHKRGREIFGSLVPWGAVWRTGANAATQFTTDADLIIGDASVPKGAYTLWTIPTPDGGSLIVNKETRQWGTEYDPAQDLVRIPMRRSALPLPVEVFAIAVDSTDHGGVLRLDWDTSSFSVPIAVSGTGPAGR